MNSIKYSLLSNFSEIDHFCTTRNGGCSEGNYGTFNLSPYCGDNIENQQSNLELLASELNLPKSQIIIPFQNHGNVVKIIEPGFNLFETSAKMHFLNGVDALITQTPGVCIGVTTADCVPLLIFDKTNNVIAAVHAGWRGTCSRIVQKTIEQMMRSFGTNPEHVFVSIGVSISPAVYNVGSELISEFERSEFDVDKIFIQRDNQLFLDLWTANKLLLEACGVPENQIEISGICSYSQSDNFFSARKLGIKSGRMLSGIMIR